MSSGAAASSSASSASALSAPGQPSLRSMARDKILRDMVGAVLSDDSSYGVLIVDEHGLRVLNAVCKTYHLNKQNVAVVENIHLARQPLPKFKGIYLVAPTEAAVEQVVRDFVGGPRPLYESAHIFFLSTPSAHVVDVIRDDKRVLPYVKTMKVINMDFLGLEPFVYSFGQTNVLAKLFNLRTKQHAEAILQRIATRLSHVCVTLGELPFIRYDASAPHMRELAQMTRKEIQRVYANSQLKPSSRATLLLLSRTSDVITPLVHEFTYQAAMADLLSFKDQTYEYTSTGTEKKTMPVLLDDDSDNLWPRYRHMHMSDLGQLVATEFDKFRSESVVVQKFREEEKSVQAIGELREALKRVPGFEHAKRHFAVHTDILTKLNDRFDDLNMNAVAALEQDLATGFDQSGDDISLKNLMPRITSLLVGGSLPTEVRQRLLMLLQTSQAGVKSSDFESLIEKAKLTPIDRAALDNLRMLTIPKPRTPEEIKARRKEARERVGNCYVVSRYVPPLKGLLLAHCNNTLSTDDDAYPYVVAPPEFATDIGSPAQAQQAAPSKARNFGWHNKVAGAADKSDAAAGDRSAVSQGGAPVIVFVLGGATFSEVRCAAEVSAETKRMVVCGGTSIISPQDFLRDVVGVTEADIVADRDVLIDTA